MIAYKGFHKDLSCSMGKGIFQYTPRVWYKEETATCARTGFHATDNPLDVLLYYDGPDDRYFIVELRGNIDEDAVNSRISAPEIMLREEISKNQLILQGVQYIIDNPKKLLSDIVQKNKGRSDHKSYAIVIGEDPVAKGEKGDTLWLIRQQGEEVTEVGYHEVDGVNIMENVYYNCAGEAVA